MLKKLILENWKSFRYAELPIDPLTVLIGTNASGKSNAIEALEFLKRIAQGELLRTALIGGQHLTPIRGGADLAVLKSKGKFTLQTLIQGEDEFIEYLYSITVETAPKIQLVAESLLQIKSSSETGELDEQIKLFELNNIENGSAKFQLEVFNAVYGTEVRNFDRPYSRLQLVDTSLNLFGIGLVSEAIKTVLRTLTNICVLNPIPSKMRVYSFLSEDLQSDASNIAGVMATLPSEEKKHVEENLSNYASHVPDRDIQRVWVETVGRLESDAMLYCEESWAPDEPPIIMDARGMSDGTLRFLAIVTALLTRPEGSQLVIEEVDNGLHPSRTELLLKMLRELGEKRKIDILVTTHNPALLNALGRKMIPFVVVAHRDSKTGESKLTPVDDIQNLPKLLASGQLGDLATQGSLEENLSSAS
jgi:predicted ATPase